MSLSVGIVGLPNVGKSTLFNALLKQQVAFAANYPFATIEPNVGIVPVADDRLEILAQIVHTKTRVPATVKFVDIAGLVAGASKGEGLGNTFLSHIREVDLICHVLRAFNDGDVVRAGSVNPKEDCITIETELQLADLSTLEKQKEPKGVTEKTEKARWNAVQKFLQAVRAGQSVRTVIVDDEEKGIAKGLGLLTAKPMMYIINCGEEELVHADEIQKKSAQELGVDPSLCVVISAKIESELSSLSVEDQIIYMKDLGVTESGLDRLVKAAYVFLGLQSFLTAGEKEVRAWTIQKGMTAPEAAGVIHTDFTKKFISARVCSYADFVEFGGWKGVREQGRMRQEGRDYIMQFDDVVEFMIGS